MAARRGSLPPGLRAGSSAPSGAALLGRHLPPGTPEPGGHGPELAGPHLRWARPPPALTLDPSPAVLALGRPPGPGGESSPAPRPRPLPGPSGCAWPGPSGGGGPPDTAAFPPPARRCPRSGCGAGSARARAGGGGRERGKEGGRAGGRAGGGARPPRGEGGGAAGPARPAAAPHRGPSPKASVKHSSELGAPGPSVYGSQDCYFGHRPACDGEEIGPDPDADEGAGASADPPPRPPKDSRGLCLPREKEAEGRLHLDPARSRPMVFPKRFNWKM
ncbi:uncharacterized protein [Callorhinus ursinus]|uniref:uncharacterized protein n=1 Tax=Callorhinus ursinus TaxID=34884 RepID=UPI003CD04864